MSTRSTFETTPITDLELELELAFKPVRSVKLGVGANNLFNIDPDTRNPALRASYRADNNNAAVTQYPTFSPYGFNGGYDYVKLGYTF